MPIIVNLTFTQNVSYIFYRLFQFGINFVSNGASLNLLLLLLLLLLFLPYFYLLLR